MGEYPPTLPTSWGDLASLPVDPPSSPRQLRPFLSTGLLLQRRPPSENGNWGTGCLGLKKGSRMRRAGIVGFGSDGRGRGRALGVALGVPWDSRAWRAQCRPPGRGEVRASSAVLQRVDNLDSQGDTS